MRLDVRHLEIHVANACNLSCEGCSHYSNYRHEGVVALEEADRWMAAWSARLHPRVFSLVGGEPTIHPRLPDFVRLSRSHWPDAQLRLVTNGFYLHKHPDLPRVLQGDPDVHVYLSVHHRAREYRDALKPNVELLQRWAREYGLRVHYYDSYRNWRRGYRGEGATMQPYADGDARASWKNCTAKDCPQLFEAKLWKCSPLAYLRMQHAKVGLAEVWRPYLQYQPLEPGCSEAELHEFFAREEEAACGMCPAKPERFTIRLPL